MLKKVVAAVFIILVVVIVALVAGRNFVVKAAVTSGVKAVTGLTLNIDSVNIGIGKTLLGITGVTLYNPPGFTDKVMVDVPEIYVDYDAGALLKKKIHLEEVRLNIKEFVVVRNAEGVLNLDSLKPVQTAQPKPAAAKPDSGKTEPAPQINIDVLRLKIGTVVYKDYSQGATPKTREFKINIDETYEHITDPQALARLIVVKALKNTTIAGLVNFDVKSLAESLKGSVGGIEGTALETTDAVTGALKKLLPFGKKQ
ncbi:MAG: AsmA family protein [Candidatus Omnitrophica bacterium]|jgi:uncharacterized protein involved in outer membrane biogenesis|nr:AsmA family protein [Candidatus Omnitrophota bacterium]